MRYSNDKNNPQQNPNKEILQPFQKLKQRDNDNSIKQQELPNCSNEVKRTCKTRPITILTNNNLFNYSKPPINTPNLGFSIEAKNIDSRNNNNNIPIISSPFDSSSLLKPTNIQKPIVNNREINREMLNPKTLPNMSNILLEEKYRLYRKYFRQNCLIQTQLSRVNNDKQILLSELGRLEEQHKNMINSHQNNLNESYISQIQNQDKDKSQNQKDGNGKKKRFRRAANQIVRSFGCPVQECDRMYGTQASLLQHIKLKHKLQYDQLGSKLMQTPQNN